MTKKTRLLPLIAIAALIGGPVASPALAQSSETLDIDVSQGKACWAEAYTNAGATWTMTLKDGDDTVAVFQGAGTNFAPMQVIEGSARFTVKSSITATFTSGTGMVDMQIVYSTINSPNGDPAVFGHLIGGEDSTDDDWQDILANITCLHHAG